MPGTNFVIRGQIRKHPSPPSIYYLFSRLSVNGGKSSIPTFDNRDDVNISTGNLKRANLFLLGSNRAEVKIIPSRDARVSMFEAWSRREKLLSTVDTSVLNAPIENRIFRPFEKRTFSRAPLCAGDSNDDFRWILIFGNYWKGGFVLTRKIVLFIVLLYYITW